MLLHHSFATYQRLMATPVLLSSDWKEMLTCRWEGWNRSWTTEPTSLCHHKLGLSNCMAIPPNFLGQLTPKSRELEKKNQRKRSENIEIKVSGLYWQPRNSNNIRSFNVLCGHTMSRSQEKIGEKWGGKAFFEPTLVTVKCEITFFPPDLIYSTRQNEDGKKNMNAMRNEAGLSWGMCLFHSLYFCCSPRIKYEKSTAGSTSWKNKHERRLV